MKIGLNLWTAVSFGPRIVPPLTEVFEKAKEFGYDGVELVYDDASMNPQKIGGEERRRWRESLESLGLQVPSVATGVFWKYNLGSNDERVREEGKKYIRLGLELASDFDARVLLVVPAVADPSIPYAKIYENAVNSIRGAAKAAEDHGVVIGLENVWNKFLYSPLEFRRFIEDVGSDFVKFYFDVGNVVALGYHEHWIGVLGDLIAMVHVKDFDAEIGGLRAFRHIGRGSIDWPRVLGLLRGAGYDDFLNVECPPSFYPDLKEPRMPEDGYRAARDNAEALRRFLSK